MKIEHFEDLEIWKEARDLCKFIKVVTDGDLFSRDYKFREQIRCSAGSTMDNIAEGFERDGIKEFIQFLSIAKGSCGEIRSQAYRAFDYKFITQEQFNELIERTLQLSKKISRLLNYLKTTEIKGTKFKKPET